MFVFRIGGLITIVLPVKLHTALPRFVDQVRVYIDDAFLGRDR